LIANYIFGVSLLQTPLTEFCSRIFPVSRRFTVLPLHMQFSKNLRNTSHLSGTHASKFARCFGRPIWCTQFLGRNGKPDWWA